MNEHEVQPRDEILWTENRGAIRFRAIRSHGIVRIEAEVICRSQKGFRGEDYETFDAALIGDIKRILVMQIAEACEELARDIRG
jgi:hypothetical protein